MRGLFVAAVVLFASSAVQAQYQLDYNGQTIRIDPDRGTVSIPGVYDNTNQKPKRQRRDDATRRQAPHDAKSDTNSDGKQQTAPQITPTDTAGTATGPSMQPASPPSAGTTATVAPNDAAKPAAPSVPPAPNVAQPPAAQPAPTPVQAATAPVVTTPAPIAAAPPSRDPNSPLGIWLTEEKQGKIRIETCGGTNLCGYAVDAKSNQNREKILIDMRPSQEKKQDKTIQDKTIQDKTIQGKTIQDKTWSGRIFDPESGSTYDSTIAMKGPDALRVQGCAFGGMFCGGQTWTRVN